jgi:hypothetical protein
MPYLIVGTRCSASKRDAEAAMLKSIGVPLPTALPANPTFPAELE